MHYPLEEKIGNPDLFVGREVANVYDQLAIPRCQKPGRSIWN